MAIVKMNLVRAAGNLSRLDRFIEACYNSGEFQPENAVEYLSRSMGFSELREENTFAPVIQKIEELAKLLGVTLKAQPVSFEEISNTPDAGKVSAFEQELARIYAERKELTDQLEACDKGIEQFSHFESLDVDLGELFACEFIKIRFGHFPKDSYYKLLAYDENPYLFFVPCSNTQTEYWGAYFAPQSKVEEIDRIFSLLYFERIHLPGGAGSIAEIIKNLENNEAIIKEQIARLDGEIGSYWQENSGEITALYSHFKKLDELFNIRSFAAYKRNQFYFVCWMPAAYIGKLKSNLAGLDDINVEIGQSEKKNADTPVKIRNSLFVRPFEFFVTMYGMPSYGGADITAFVALTYTVIFGMMFGDLGQGLVLAAAGYLMWRFKGMALGKVLVLCGASSMFFGFIFGSVFGYENLLDPVYRAMGLASKPLPVMESVNAILFFAICIGIALVTLSMAIHVYDSMKKKLFGEALFSNNGLAGIVFYLAGVSEVYAFMSGRNLIPPAAALACLSAGGLCIFFKDFLIAKIDRREASERASPGEFVMQNIFEMLEHVLAYFSNTLSFLRVGAFVLVHAGMMMVVFSLANEGRNIVVVILGNALVIVLEGLLTGIQTLRLEFYEMFSHFLEGEGRPFRSVNPSFKSAKKQLELK